MEVVGSTMDTGSTNEALEYHKWIDIACYKYVVLPYMIFGVVECV